MQGATHLAIGAISGLILAGSVSTKPEIAAACVAAGALGGLLPDIDHPQSTVGRRLGILRLLIFWIPHRTFTHSVFPVAALAVASMLTMSPIVAAFTVGYVLHIVADMATIQGVPIFTPIWRERVRLLPKIIAFETGGIREKLLLLMILAFGAYVAFQQWLV